MKDLQGFEKAKQIFFSDMSKQALTDHVDRAEVFSDTNRNGLIFSSDHHWIEAGYSFSASTCGL